MKDTINGVDPYSLPQLRISTNWSEIQILTDPFVIKSALGYGPVILVEELSTERKYIMYVSAKSLSNCLEPLRERRGALVGLNIRVRKTGDERISPYEAEELAE